MGSFSSALVWRLRHKRNWVSERSECEHCHHVLAWYDLLPVLSWLQLRGKCRYCHKSLSIEYPIAELVTAAAMVGLYQYWPHGMMGWQLAYFGLWVLLVIGFVILSIYDLKWFLLPNRFVYPLLAIVLCERAVSALALGDVGIVRDAVLGILVGGGIFWLLFQVSNGKWIGGGDVKLGFLLGASVGGLAPAFLMLFVASSFGTLYAVYMLARGKMKRTSHIPFGPFLMAAAYFVVLFGDRLINWYVDSLTFGAFFLLGL